MEPPAYVLHQWGPETGLVSHHVYIDAYEGPYLYRDDVPAAPDAN